MATVKPFAALRPDPALAGQICQLPYDVLSSDEARVLATNNPLSFFHVSKPEVDLDPAIDLYDPRVYEQGRRNFLRLIAEGHLRREPAPKFFLYRQIMGAHTQVGLVALTSCQDYLQNRIRKHEFTRPDKEDDRVRHIEALQAQTGPAFLVYPADHELDGLFQRNLTVQPDVDFVAADNIRHSSWTVADPRSIAKIQQQFAAMPALYIADGHHRTAAAARIFNQYPNRAAAEFFLSVLFPADQVQILAYHRVLKDLNGLSSEKLLGRLRGVFMPVQDGLATPREPHQVCLYLNGDWRCLQFRPEYTADSEPLNRLDVSLLQNHVLAPIFGVDNPRTNERIQFVGGIRGTSELERLVDSGQYACALALHPTQIGDLMAIADTGGIMPPKSTWFEPKLRDGMFSYLLNPD